LIETRIYKYNEIPFLGGNVAYLMTRENRLEDNYSLLTAIEYALQTRGKLYVVCSKELFPKSFTEFHTSFYFSSLYETALKLKALNIPLILIEDKPQVAVNTFIKVFNINLLITDFYPLKELMKFNVSMANELQIPFWEVDSHNIVPCRVASNKQEFGAYTIRPKINKILSDYLVDFDKISYYPYNLESESKPTLEFLDIYKNYKYKNFNSGSNSANEMLNNFIDNRLQDYNEKRNEPSENFQSDLSVYLNYGLISAQRIALEVSKLNTDDESKKSFLEELIIRRELSDNFCFYQKDYDNFNGFPNWAKATLLEHLNDKREYIYSLEQFENAKTHDIYWNAAQLEMMNTGKMHGYMRMYWAKKILESTQTPYEAQEIALKLNDKYELDGCDPNGFTGVAWSIGGVHDRAWTERKIFGKIRFMNSAGLKRKFNIDSYASKFVKNNYSIF